VQLQPVNIAKEIVRQSVTTDVSHLIDEDVFGAKFKKNQFEDSIS
jgi:hypothetical protein